MTDSGGVADAEELGFNDPTAQRLERITTGAHPEVVGPMLADILHDPRWLTCDVALIAGGKSNLTTASPVTRARSSCGVRRSGRSLPPRTTWVASTAS
jgi:hypothetical protein